MACKNSVQSIVDTIKRTFNIPIPSIPKIPTPILALGAPLRKGLSAEVTTSKVISRLSEAGILNGSMPDGSQNSVEAFASILIGEIFKTLAEDARVEVALPPGSVSIIGTGSNAGGPIVTQGTNSVLAAGGAGIIL